MWYALTLSSLRFLTPPRMLWLLASIASETRIDAHFNSAEPSISRTWRVSESKAKSEKLVVIKFIFLKLSFLHSLSLSSLTHTPFVFHHATKTETKKKKETKNDFSILSSGRVFVCGQKIVSMSESFGFHPRSFSIQTVWFYSENRSGKSKSHNCLLPFFSFLLLFYFWFWFWFWFFLDFLNFRFFLLFLALFSFSQRSLSIKSPSSKTNK